MAGCRLIGVVLLLLASNLFVWTWLRGWFIRWGRWRCGPRSGNGVRQQQPNKTKKNQKKKITQKVKENRWGNVSLKEITTSAPKKKDIHHFCISSSCRRIAGIGMEAHDTVAPSSLLHFDGYWPTKMKDNRPFFDKLETLRSCLLAAFRLVLTPNPRPRQFWIS